MAGDDAHHEPRACARVASDRTGWVRPPTPRPSTSHVSPDLEAGAGAVTALAVLITSSASSSPLIRVRPVASAEHQGAVGNRLVAWNTARATKRPCGMPLEDEVNERSWAGARPRVEFRDAGWPRRLLGDRARAGWDCQPQPMGQSGNNFDMPCRPWQTAAKFPNPERRGFEMATKAARGTKRTCQNPNAGPLL